MHNYMCIHMYVRMCIYTYIYTYIQNNVVRKCCVEVQSGKVCPDPGSFELSKGNLKL